MLCLLPGRTVPILSGIKIEHSGTIFGTAALVGRSRPRCSEYSGRAICMVRVN